MLVEVERGRTDLDGLAPAGEDLSMAVVTAAELLLGVELSGSRHRAPRERFVGWLLERLVVQLYDLDVARVHASLMAHGRRTGRPRGAHDLIVAATAIAVGRTLVTIDPGGFEDLPGLVVRSP